MERIALAIREYMLTGRVRPRAVMRECQWLRTVLKVKTKHQKLKIVGYWVMLLYRTQVPGPPRYIVLTVLLTRNPH